MGCQDRDVFTKACASERPATSSRARGLDLNVAKVNRAASRLPGGGRTAKIALQVGQQAQR